MNWLRHLIRVSLSKCANTQRRAFLRTKGFGFVPVQEKIQYDARFIKDYSVNYIYPIQSIEIAGPELKRTQKRFFESNGLLELKTRSQTVDGSKEMGDFAAVTQENFAHTLHFSKIDIDFANFSIDEMETVCSQAISMTEANRRQIEEESLGESDGSFDSYTETDIYIELPNSEVVGNPKQSVESETKSAAF